MDLCAKKAKGACGAAAFDSENEICYYKSRNVTENDINPRVGATIGFPFAEQLKQLPLSCTANQTSENGLNFSVYCDQDLNGSDMAVENRTHAATFSDCLDHCSTLHPRASNISFGRERGWVKICRGGSTPRSGPVLSCATLDFSGMTYQLSWLLCTCPPHEAMLAVRVHARY